MNFFRRSAPSEDRDPQIPLEPYEVTEIPWPKPEFTPKPIELVRAANEWTRPTRVPDPTPGPLTLDWRDDPPHVAGVWWYRESDVDRVGICIVVEFGPGKLCIRERRAGGLKYVSVAALDREWAGPIGIPEDVQLEDLALP